MEGTEYIYLYLCLNKRTWILYNRNSRAWQWEGRQVAAGQYQETFHCLLYFVVFEPLGSITYSKLYWNKNKTKQTEASRVLFIPLRILALGNYIWGTHCEPNNPGAWFPRKRRLLFLEGEGPSPSWGDTHTAPSVPFMASRLLLLSLYGAQILYLKVSPLLFKQNAPNKNFCNFAFNAPSPVPFKNNNKDLNLG